MSESPSILSTPFSTCAVWVLTVLPRSYFPPALMTPKPHPPEASPLSVLVSSLLSSLSSSRVISTLRTKRAAIG